MELTPTQQKIIDLLSDGLKHSREELHNLINPNAGNKNVQVHISYLRKILQARGEDIAGEVGFGLKITYRHVRLLVNPNDGRR